MELNAQTRNSAFQESSKNQTPINQKILGSFIRSISSSLATNTNESIFEMLRTLVYDENNPLFNAYLGMKFFEQFYFHSNYDYKPELINYYILKALGQNYDKLPDEFLNKIGVVLVNINELSEAEKIFTYLLEKDPKNKRAMINLAQIYLKTDLNKAIPLIEKIIEKYPNEDWAYKPITEFYFTKGDTDRTLKYLKQRADAFPDRIRSINELVLYYIYHQMYDQAENTLELVLEKYPDNPAALSLLSKLYWQIGHIYKSIAYLEKSLENLDEYLKYFKSSNPYVDLDGESLEKEAGVEPKEILLFDYFKKIIKDSTLLYNAQKFLMRLFDNGDSSVAPYIYIISRMLDDSTISKDYLALIQKTLKSYGQLEDKATINDLLKNLTEHDFLVTIKNLCVELALNGYYRIVANELSNFYKHFQSDFSVNYLLGYVYSALNENNSAVKYFYSAHQLNPGDTTIILQLAFVLNSIKRYDEGIAILEQVVDENTKDKNLLSLLALMYNNAGMYKESDEIYERALKLYPDDPLLLNNYAYSLAERGFDLDRAMEMSRKSLEIDSLNSSYLDTLGWIYFQLGDYENAKFYINLAIEQGSESAEVLEHMGDVYLKLNDKDKAKEYYKKAFEKEPDRKGLMDKINELE